AASSAKSAWLDTTPATSTGSEPVFQRNSRSFRQWPSRETMIRVRILAARSCSCQGMWNASATQEKPRSSPASSAPPGGTEKCTRMKNRSSGLSSPYCWLARMLAECWTRKLDTAYTIPGLSGQDSVSTYSRPRAALITILMVAYNTTYFSIRNNMPYPIATGQTSAIRNGVWGTQPPLDGGRVPNPPGGARGANIVALGATVGGGGGGRSS